jgi:hypothetical protein
MIKLIAAFRYFVDPRKNAEPDSRRIIEGVEGHASWTEAC